MSSDIDITHEVDLNLCVDIRLFLPDSPWILSSLNKVLQPIANVMGAGWFVSVRRCEDGADCTVDATEAQFALEVSFMDLSS
jgi:hypothetical protein